MFSIRFTTPCPQPGKKRKESQAVKLKYKDGELIFILMKRSIISSTRLNGLSKRYKIIVNSLIFNHKEQIILISI